MANEEHLEILRKGVEEWNRWREENPRVLPDLKEARLREGAILEGARLDYARLDRASLVGARLERASLVGARLNGAVLFGARLERARLDRARLDYASLDGASLDYASLEGARLYGAILDRASLDYASLEGARLDYASLDRASLVSASLVGALLHHAGLTDTSIDGARIGYTVFSGVDLGQVKGLESVEHRGPSTIGTDTLERSRGQIPEDFLKGCGFSPEQIVAAKDWPGGPPRVFVSYTRDDEAFVEALEKRFDEKGVRYWRDVHHLKAGRLERQIDRAITLYPLVLLVLSERSVLSDWVEWETAKARKLEKEYEKAGEPRDVLCPLALDDAWKSCSWPGPLRRQIEDYHVLDFSGWEDNKEKMDRQFTRLYEGMVLNYGRKSS